MKGQTLTEVEIGIAKRARIQGYVNHEIAAYFGVNQGRIAEINTGEVGAHVEPASAMPDDFPPPVRRSRDINRGGPPPQNDLFGGLG